MTGGLPHSRNVFVFAAALAVAACVLLSFALLLAAPRSAAALDDYDMGPVSAEAYIRPDGVATFEWRLVGPNWQVKSSNIEVSVTLPATAGAPYDAVPAYFWPQLEDKAKKSSSLRTDSGLELPAGMDTARFTVGELPRKTGVGLVFMFDARMLDAYAGKAPTTRTAQTAEKYISRYTPAESSGPNVWLLIAMGVVTAVYLVRRDGVFKEYRMYRSLVIKTSAIKEPQHREPSVQAFTDIHPAVCGAVWNHRNEEPYFIRSMIASLLVLAKKGFVTLSTKGGELRIVFNDPGPRDDPMDVATFEFFRPFRLVGGSDKKKKSVTLGEIESWASEHPLSFYDWFVKWGNELIQSLQSANCKFAITNKQKPDLKSGLILPLTVYGWAGFIYLDTATAVALPASFLVAIAVAAVVLRVYYRRLQKFPGVSLLYDAVGVYERCQSFHDAMEMVTKGEKSDWERGMADIDIAIYAVAMGCLSPEVQEWLAGEDEVVGDNDLRLFSSYGVRFFLAGETCKAVGSFERGMSEVADRANKAADEEERQKQRSVGTAVAVGGCGGG